jgi:hypothetical protein
MLADSLQGRKLWWCLKQSPGLDTISTIIDGLRFQGLLMLINIVVGVTLA